MSVALHGGVFTYQAKLNTAGLLYRDALCLCIYVCRIPSI